jgi:hypothetical protein
MGTSPALLQRLHVKRAASLATALVAVLLVSAAASAQDAGVSGIPPGPANARGLNGSVNDPSGIGNAAKIPVIPPPKITPIAPPAVPPLVSTDPVGPIPQVVEPWPVEKAAKTKRKRAASSRSHRTSARAVARDSDRQIDHTITSICRGC